MNCLEIKGMISRYVDDDLAPDERSAFTLHIRDCSDCRKELEETESVHALFASAERFAAPHGFTTRVMANLEDREPSRFWNFLTFHRSLVRAAELVLALVVFTIGIISGNVLVADRTSEKLMVQANLQASFSLDLFQAEPPGSVGGAYVGLMGVADER